MSQIGKVGYKRHGVKKVNNNSKGKEAGEGMKGGCLMQGGGVSARRKWAQKVAHRHGR